MGTSGRPDPLQEGAVRMFCPLPRRLHAEFTPLPVGRQFPYILPYAGGQFRLRAPFPGLPLRRPRLLLFSLVLVRIDPHLAAVDVIPREIEAPMLLTGEL